MRRLILIVFILFAGYLSFHPNPVYTGVWDKYLHAAFSCALAALLWWNMEFRPWIRAFWTLVLGLAAGVGVEVVQSYIPGRHGAVDDLIADVIGILVAVLALWLMAATPVPEEQEGRRRGRRRSRADP